MSKWRGAADTQIHHQINIGVSQTDVSRVNLMHKYHTQFLTEIQY